MAGTRLAREVETLYKFYRSQEFTRPMRCYCALLRGLPDDERVSIAYCNYSKAFVKKFWETILERPVRIELTESVVSGGLGRKFSIHI